MTAMKNSPSRNNRAVERAASHALERLENRMLLAVDVPMPSWVEQGPSPINGGQIGGIPDSPVTGAINAVAADPTNANRAFVATVNGGIWRTTSATSAKPDWEFLTDRFPSLSVSDIAFAPGNANKIYAGIGGFSSGNQSGRSTGVLRSLDGGNTWRLMGREAFRRLRIVSVVPTNLSSVGGDVVLVAATDLDGGGGVYRTTDSGETWEKVSGKTANGLPLGSATHLAIDPNNNNVVYAGLSGDWDVNNNGRNDDSKDGKPLPWTDKGVFRSTDGGLHWTDVTDGLRTPRDKNTFDEDADGTVDETNEMQEISDRIRLSVSKAPGAPVYAATLLQNQVWSIHRSTDLGATWVSMDLPGTRETVDQNGNGTIDPGESSVFIPLHPGGQANRHFSMLADASDPNVVFVGGDREPGLGGTTEPTLPNSLGSDNFYGRLFRGDASLPEGLQWEGVVSNGADPDGAGPKPGTAPHADSRNMVFDANHNILEVDDGGIFRLVDPGNKADVPGLRHWQVVNGDLGVTEFYSAAWNRRDRLVIAGAQDVGTSTQASPGNKTWRTIDQGDGGIIQVDNSGANPVVYFSRDQLGNFSRVTLDRVDNDGDGSVDLGDFTEWETIALRVDGAGIKVLSDVDSGLQFVQPYVLNAADPTRLMIGTRSALYESRNRGDMIRSVAGLGARHRPLNPFRDQRGRPVTGNVTAMVYGGFEGATAKPDVAWVSVEDHLFVRTTAGNTFTEVGSFPGRNLGQSVRDIVVDPTNWKRAWVVNDSNVYFTPDGGANWEQVSLFLRGVSDFRTVELVKDGATETLLVGGLGGVIRTTNPTSNAATWTEFGQKLPNVLVTDLRYDATADVLLAATFGRGAWTMTNVRTQVDDPAVVTVTGTAGDDNFYITLNPNNPALLDIYVNDVALSNPTTVPVSPIERIVVNGLAGDDHLTVHFGNGTFNIPNNIHFEGGEGGEDAPTPGDTLTLDPGGSDATSISLPPVNEAGKPDVFGKGGNLQVSFVNTEHFDQKVPDVFTKSVATLGHGLQEFSDWSSRLNDQTLFGQEVPLLGQSVGRMLNGFSLLESGSRRLPAAGAAQFNNAVNTRASQLLTRIFESGLGAFDLSSIGADVDTVAELEALLESLDATDNVTVVQNGTETRFDVRINKTLSGTAEIDVDAIGGLFHLTGNVVVSADVAVHVVLGVDAQGFFIDAEGNLDPEFVVSNIKVDGRVQATGSIGFIGVELTGGTLSLDPKVKLSVNLHDPGTAAEDGRIRLSELRLITNDLATAEFQGNASANDLTFTGQFGVKVFNSPLFSDIQVTLAWPDITSLEGLQLTAAPGSTGQNLLSFLNVNAATLAAGLGDLANWATEVAGEDVLATQVPLINKTIGEILGSYAQPLVFTNSPAVQMPSIGRVETEGQYKKFTVVFDKAVNLLKAGVQAGQKVEYRKAGAAVEFVEGVVDQVSATGLTVRFDAALTQDPHTSSPVVRIFRPGGLQAQLAATFGILSRPAELAVKVPTLQELLDELADLTGVNVLADLRVVGSSLADLAVELPLSFNPDPIRFTQQLDLANLIQGLALDATGDFSFEANAKLGVRVGLRLGPNVPAAERFYLVKDDANEIQLDVTAKLDNINVGGRLGFLNVALAEKDPATGTGVTIGGTVGINLTDVTPNKPGITLGDLHPADLLDAFDSAFSLNFKIDPLVLSAAVGTSTLGSLTVSLPQTTVDSLSEFGTLLSNVTVTGNLDAFKSFNNITPQMIVQALVALVEQLRAMGGGGVVDTKLPLIDASLSDVVDFGQALVQKLDGDPVTPELDGIQGSAVGAAKQLQDFINSKINPSNNPGGPFVTVAVNPGDIRFAFAFDASFDKTFPFSFDLGNSLGLVSAGAGGGIAVSAKARVGLNLGFATAAGLDLEDRIFLGSAGADEISVTATASAGYDLNDDGDLNDAGEAQPIDFNASVAVLNLSVNDARALIRAGLALDVRDGGGTADGKLTLAEIASNVSAGTFDNLVTGTFSGDAQAILPLDGDGGGVATDPALLPGTADARIEVAGLLKNLGNVEFHSDPGPAGDVLHHTNPTLTADNAGTATADIADPLKAAGSGAEIDPNRFLIAAHNLEGLIQNGFLNFNTLLDGLENLIGWAGDMLGADVLNFEIPFVGKTFKEAFDFVGSDAEGAKSLRNVVDTFVDNITSSGAPLAATSNQAVYAIARALGDALKGIPGILAVGDADGDGSVEPTPGSGDDLIQLLRGSELAVTFDGATITLEGDSFRVAKPGVNFLAEGKGIVVGDEVHWTTTSGPGAGRVAEVQPEYIVVRRNAGAGNPADADTATEGVQASVTVDTAEITGVTFVFKFAPGVNIPLFNNAFDLGLDFLDVSSTASVSFVGSLEMTLGFGISREDGFFFKTDFSELGVPASQPEFSLNGKIEVDGGIDIKFGFLGLHANFDDAAAEDDFMSIAFGADVDGGSDKRLTMDELLAFSPDAVDFVLPVAAKARVPLSVDLNNSDLPAMKADFELDWAFDLLDVAGDSADFTLPTIAIRDMRLDAGSFLRRVAKKVFEQVNKYNVLGPIVDALDDPLPIVGMTPFELLISNNPGLDSGDRKVAEFLFNIVKFIKDTDAAGGANLEIHFGDFGVTRAGGAVPVLAGFTNHETGREADPAKEVASIPGSGLPLVGDFIKRLGSDLGITFPALRLSNLAKMVTGNDVDLVFVDMPRFTAGYDFNVNFPLFSYGIPMIADVYVEAFIGGGLDFFVDLDFGFDTSGLRKGLDKFYEGIWIGDYKPGIDKQIGPDDFEKQEVGFESAIHAGIDAGVRVLGMPLAHITGEGTIGASIGIDLNDDNKSPHIPGEDNRTEEEKRDGKFHVGEITEVLESNGYNPLCLFDLTGQLGAELEIKIEVDVFLFSFSWSFKDQWLILDFEVECEPIHVTPDFANVVGNTLVLTSTTADDHDHYNARAGTNHEDGDVVDVVLVDKNNNADDGLILLDLAQGKGSVSGVNSTGFHVSGPAAAQFRARGIEKNQRVRYKSGGVDVFGTLDDVTDSGFDVLLDNPSLTPDAGTGFTVFSGKESIRVKKGGFSEDFGPQETGNNFVANINNITLIADDVAGAPNNEMGGFGAGADKVTVDPLLRTPVRLHGGGDSDTLTGGSGGGALYGGDGDDFLRFATAPSDLTAAERTKWNATLSGGAGNDLLTAGPGDDLLVGGEGNDTLDGGAAADRATSVGDPAGGFGDEFAGLDYGVSGADTVVGGGGNDLVDGRGGNDVLVGDYDATHDPRPSSAPARHEGADVINADEGNDLIWGDNRDSLSGDGPQAAADLNTADQIFAGANNDKVFAGAGNDRVDAGADAGLDTVHAGAGADTVVGGDGADSIAGNAGDDSIEGGTGADRLYGGNDVQGPDLSEQGSDLIIGGDDDDLVDASDSTAVTARGGAGNDSVLGSRGADLIYGDAGRDFVVGGPNNDQIRGGEGDDDVVGGKGTAGGVTFDVAVSAADGADSVFGEAGNDVLLGDSGTINSTTRAVATTSAGGAGIDTVFGDAGDDTIFGGGAGDRLDGDAPGGVGLDVVVGDEGTADAGQIIATASASAGNDTITGSGGNDTVLGGGGHDNIAGDTGNDVLLGDNGKVTLSAGAVTFIETTDFASGGDDFITGSAGSDVILGGSGSDNLSGGTAGEETDPANAADIIFGDNGSVVPGGDVTSNSTTGAADTVNGGVGNDTLVGGAGGDSVGGDVGGDVIVGDHGKVTRVSSVVTRVETLLEADGGNDTVQGQAGSDTVLGGTGADNLDGGTENDFILGDNGLLDYIDDNDSDPTSLDLITTRNPTVGDGDTIEAGDGDDVVMGGTGAENLHGGAGRDLVFGDHGKVDLDLPAKVYFQSVDTGFAQGGASDTLHGDAQDDTLIGGQGGDSLFGGDGDDDLIGGHNVAGGSDAGDTADGGTGNDFVAGDNASIVRRVDDPSTPIDESLVSPLYRTLSGATMYNLDGTPAVVLAGGGATRPTGVVAFGRDIFIFDHTNVPTNHAGMYGSDFLAGGSGIDFVFGQLGDDTLQGDGSAAPLVNGRSFEAATDGDDYVEGNGGNDTIFGNGGQDDLIGGSSHHYGLSDPSQRPDGADTIYGGAGTRTGINDAGDTATTGHAADADMIVGDNGNVYRLVGASGPGATVFLDFKYDTYTNNNPAGSRLKIVPRAVELIDYTANGNALDDTGAGDVIHGEAGDDSVHGAAGNDQLFGDGQDDDLFGESGNDWISGGAGDDGVLGDNGKLFTSRNGIAEPLYVIAATTQERIASGGNIHTATINVTGQLKKTADLEPFSVGGNDTAFGGLGNDSVHGGAGVDALSGAEALEDYYNNHGTTPALVFNDAAGDFELMNDNAPLTKVNNHPLNFLAFNSNNVRIDDGQDALFGDEGNDWLVGGTNSDHLYGGVGHDVMNADDNLETNGGLNNVSDTGAFAEADTVYGGGGRDTLMGNTVDDRLADWVGEFNAYAVPFSPFGNRAIARQILPGLVDFLLKLARSDGADQTRVGPGLGTAARNGEPYGELGMFLQQDSDWRNQTGAPADPQPQ